MPAARAAGSTKVSATPTEAEVRIQWPDGETGPWMTIDADQFVTIERGATDPTPWLQGE